VVRVDGVPFEKLGRQHRQVLLKTISSHAEKDIGDSEALEEWLETQSGGERSFRYEGVKFQTADGDTFGVPFELFPEQDERYLRPGWKQWLAANQAVDADQAAPADRTMADQATLYLRARSQLAGRERLVNMLANQLRIQTAFGLSYWRVQLYPKPGTTAPPMPVVVPARNSREAAAVALVEYPRHQVGSIARIDSILDP
jgi:hypothetical protein